MFLISEIFHLGRISSQVIIVLYFSILSNLSPVSAHRPGAPNAGWFTENRGQWHPDVKYRIQLDGTTVFLEEAGLMLVFHDQQALNNLLRFKYSSAEAKKSGNPDPIIDHYAARIIFEGGRVPEHYTGIGRSPDYENYFIGSDPENWTSNVGKYNEVRYQSLYEGIDVRYHLLDEQLNYDFLLNPGADPSQIKLRFEGIKSVRKKDGDLVFITPLGEFTDKKPIAWQLQGGQRFPVRCRYNLKGDIVSFSFPDGYDTNLPLVIDPVLVFASYSGSTADNWGYTATYDEKGFLYAAGCAFNTGYPVVTGSYQVNFAGGVADIVLTKYDTSGSFLIYSTYLGGSGTEVPSSLVVNNSNQLVLMGTTGSFDFPVTTGSWDNSFSGGTPFTLTSMLTFTQGSDIVLCKFSPDGTSLLSSTYAGGQGNDGLNYSSPLKYNYADEVRGEVLVDNQDNVYFISTTRSLDFPTTSQAFRPSYSGGEQDACVMVLSSDLSQRLWASYAGGSDKDAGYSITIGNGGSIYIAGGTTSTNLQTSILSLQPSFNGGSSDGFIYEIAPDGKSLLASTYYGSSLYDQVYFVKTDKQGNVYVLGQTADTSGKFTYNSIWGTPHGGQFISKLNPLMNAMLWSVNFGITNDNPDVSPTAFMVDLCNNVYLSAWGSPILNPFGGGVSGLPLSANAFQTTTDNNDYYFMVLNDNASALVYGSYYGGSSHEHVDGGTSRFDRRGVIYQSVCAGCGGSDNFPTTTGAWSNVNGSSNCNNGVIKFDFDLPLVIADFPVPPSGCAPYTVNLVNASSTTGSAGLICLWDFGDGFTSAQCNPTHTYTQSGVYNITLSITDTGSCNYFDTISRVVVVLSGIRDTLPDENICLGDYTQIGIPPTPDTSISYQWNPASGLNDASLPNPIAAPGVTTMYSVIISNSSCRDTLFQKVVVYDLQTDAGPDTSICDTTITLQASCSIQPAQFIWSSKPDFSDTLNLPSLSGTVNVNLTGPGKYYVKAFNNWCFDTDSLFVDFMILVSPAVVVNPTCYGYCDGLASVNPSGGILPYSYIWSNGQTGDTAFNLCAGNYSVTITDAFQCRAIVPVVVSNPSPIVLQPEIENIPCAEVCMGSITLNASGSHPPYNYQWSNGQSSDPLMNLCQGTYSVTVTDSRNCTLSDTFDVVVDYVFQNMITGASEDTIYEGQSTSIFATGVMGFNYSWTPAASLTNPSYATTVAKPSLTQVYQLEVTDQYGCVFRDSVRITVIDVNCGEPYVYIPNAFTPNDDHKNDVLYVRGNVFTEMQLLIYNRWGEKVFETEDALTGWDGRFKGEYCEPGVFVYYLKVRCFNEEIYEKKGNVTLIR